MRASGTLLRGLLCWSALCFKVGSAVNSTEYWLGRREALIDSVLGYGAGVLSNRSEPDEIVTWPEEPGLQGLVWNMTTLFPITSTVFFSPVKVGQRSKDAFFFHHGHSDCVCPSGSQSPVEKWKCRPGCNSSMPSRSEIGLPGYSWWDLYNISDFFHGMGYDVFIFSMPLKGINMGPGTNSTFYHNDHWWFLQWEQQGDHALRYFLEPVVMTANFAVKAGYSDIFMAGLSGGGWSTTFSAAMDPRIKASFPIAGSLPCAMRDPRTGTDAEDFEQSCMPTKHPVGPKDDKPGRAAFAACNYTCMYLLAGLEPERFQVQILHEYDGCCFPTHGRHDKVLAYEAGIRAELAAGDRQLHGHGWFTATTDNHTKHEVCAQDKAILASAMAGRFPPSSQQWESMPCDILHQPLPAHCPANVEPGRLRFSDPAADAADASVLRGRPASPFNRVREGGGESENMEITI